MAKRALVIGLMMVAVGACSRRLPVRSQELSGPVGAEVALSGAKANRLDQVFLEIHCARVRVAGRLHELTRRGAPPAPGSTFVKRLSSEEAAVRLAAWRADPRVEIVQAPRVLALNLQEASVFIGESATNAKPEQAAWLGSSFRATPRVRHGGSEIRMDYHHRIKLSDPAILREDMTKAEWASAVSAMPYAATDVAFRMPSGGHVLIQNVQQVPHSEGDYWIDVLLSARVLPDAQGHEILVEMAPIEDSIDGRR